MVEAKKEDITTGCGQCVATMVAAQLFNHQNHEPIATVFGVVTNGETWKFLSLSGTQVNIDAAIYSLSVLDTLLGVLWHVTQ